jgi:hypothetical protein
MKNERLDNFIQKALAWMDREKKSKARPEDFRKDCLSEETLCDYLGNRLTPSDKEKAEKHLSFCSNCRRVLTTVVDLESSEFVKSREKVKLTMEEFSEGLKISLKWIGDHLTLKDTNAKSFPFWNALNPVLVRGDQQHEMPSLPPFSKTFKEFKIIVRVREEEKGRCELECQISPLAKLKVRSRVRAELLQAERIIFSYPLEKDSFKFNGIEPGKYEIRIRKNNNILAHIAINVSTEDEE